MRVLHPLDDRSRLRRLAVAATLCSIAALFAPLAGRSSFAERAAPPEVYRESTAPSQPAPIAGRPPIVVTRDPFVTPQPAVSQTALPAAEVRAIVSGRSPRALVETNGDVRILGVGDAFLNSKIVAIDETGVHLENGIVIPAIRQVP